VDGEGGVAIPAFHDAHLHLLSYARTRSRVDCRAARSIGALQAALAAGARGLPPGAWLRAYGYDEARLAEGRQPDRYDLDAAVPDRPLRLQHRGLHLDVLNTLGLRALGPLAAAPAVERDPATGEPTGRLYHAGALLHDRLDRPTEDELARDVRQASDQLLAWGVTTVQDASVTNGLAEWELFHRLAARGALQQRVFVLPGAAGREQIAAGRLPTERVRLGPVKLMVNEATADLAAVRAAVVAARVADRRVAIHAVSEAEVAIALEALRGGGDRSGGLPPDRIEHGAVIADAWLDDLRALRVAVVGQPALVYERGDVYRAAYPPALQGWLHRARSLLRAGIRYAAGSDAPVTEPAPGLGLFAARQRRTREGAALGAAERLTAAEALSAFTVGPAAVVGAAHELGRLRPGMLADLAVLDADVLGGASLEAARRPVRLTISEGRVVWRRGASSAR
jgi:predicted amidohydrolase YtcJ